MKLATICPPNAINYLPYRAGYHMALAQYLLEDTTYLMHMEQQVARGGFIIMDNGAAEGQSLTITELIAAVDLLEPDEVVLPDVLRDADRTLALHTHTNVLTSIPPIQRMVVIQGSKWSEVKYFIRQLTAMKRWFHYASIGVPKHLESLKGGRPRAIKLLVEYGLAMNHNIHLLGIYAKPFEEVMRAYEAFPGIRGIDTGAPVAYAQHHIRLTDLVRFSLEWNGLFDTLHLRNNILIYSAFCYKGLVDELKGLRSKVYTVSPGQRTIRALEDSKII